MARPFLKWAGGKTQLLPQLLDAAPARIDVYYEPFLGGGAFFFALQSAGRFRSAVLSDSNDELINAYLQVRDRVEDLIHALSVHQRKYGVLAGDQRADYYYQIRAKHHSCDLGGAARLIFLNKTCFNGLYRVNSRGEFNVPHGRYANPVICDEANLRGASAALSGVELVAQDFAAALSWAGRGDFVYCDPPYMPLSTTASFTSYTSADFGPAEQERLMQAAADARDREASILLSNSGHADVTRLYAAAGFQLEAVAASRTINSNAQRRGPVREYLIHSA